MNKTRTQGKGEVKENPRGEVKRVLSQRPHVMTKNTPCPSRLLETSAHLPKSTPFPAGLFEVVRVRGPFYPPVSREGTLDNKQEDSGEAPQINFIADNVAEADSFASHSRIARAIATVIRQKRDLKVIGLLGSWGSGKSTVVNFVEKLIRNSASKEEFYFFRYDAWLLQSDPPRRAFLETLINFLVDQKGVTTAARWEDRLLELNRQVENAETTSTPSLSTAGRFLLPSALLVPIGMQLIGHDWYDALSSGSTWFDGVAYYIGWLFIFAPAFVALAIYLYWRPTRKIWSKEFWITQNWTTHRAPYEADSILSIFTNREIQHTNNRTVRSPDPTTIEFQSIFREIMSEVSSSDRRYVFVIDNLDRLPEEQAVELWATIRSFFLGAKQSGSLPTVILPIDEGAVRRMYASNHADPEMANALAQSFMDKTFDLKFHVSRPVLSNWHEYLELQMTELFGDYLQIGWSHRVHVIFDRWVLKSSPDAEITPRIINTALNDIGILWLQWFKSNIPFASIAYYAINRNSIGSKILEEVTSGDVGLAHEDPDWQISLAALHYGVDVSEASQVLLERPLSEAIQGGNTDAFAAHAKVAGFEQVFERILDRAATNGTGFSATNAILLYEHLELPETAQTIEVWRRLRNLYIIYASPDEIDSVDATALAILMARCPRAKRDVFIREAAARMSSIGEGTYVKGGRAANFVAACRVISTAADELGVGGLKLVVKGDPKAYLQILSLAGDDANLLGRLKSGADGSAIAAALASALQDLSTAKGSDVCVRLLKQAGTPLPWKVVIDAAGTKLESTFDAATAIAANCLGILRKSEAAAQFRADQLLDNGNLVQRFNEAYSGKNVEACASLAALILVTKNPAALSPPDGVPWPSAFSAHEGLAEQLAERLSEFGGAEDMNGYAAIGENNGSLAPAMKAVASEQFRMGKLNLPDPATVAEQFVFYTSYLDDDLAVRFASAIGEKEEFWEKLSTLPLTKNAMTYRMLLNEESTVRARSVEVTTSALKQVTVDQWQAALSGKQPYPIAAALVAANPAAEIEGNLCEGLRLAIQSLTSGADPTLRERWFELAIHVKPSLRKTLFKSVTDALAATPMGSGLTELLSAQDNVLLREGALFEKAEGAVRNIVLPLVGSSELDWLCDRASFFSTVIAKSSTEARDAVANQITVRLEAENQDEAKQRIANLRSDWGLPATEEHAPEEPPGAEAS